MDTNPTLPPSVYPVDPRRNSVGKIVIWIVIVLVVIAVGIASYLFYKGKTHLGSLIGFSPVSFGLLETNGVQWFSLQGSTVTPETGAIGFDKITPKIIEATQELKSKDTPVIAQVSSSSASENQLGLIRNGQFLSLLTLTKNDTNPKLGLTASDDGTIVFSESSSTISKNWNLYALSLYSSPQTFLSLGSGFDPEFASTAGAVLAIAPEGLVRVSPVGDGRYPLITRAGMNYAAATISPDATLALLPNKNAGTLDLFSIDPIYANRVSYLSSIHDAFSTAAAFISPTAFIVQDGSTHFTKYEWENKKFVITSLTFKMP